MPRYTYSMEPPQSCPDFDDAVHHIEKARKINEELRAWGEAGWQRVEELEDALTEVQDRVRTLKRRADEWEDI
jgi:predicted metal-dependent TIM-barrel fold hydrolase